MKSYIEPISDDKLDTLTECANEQSYLDSATDVESFMFPIPEELDVFSNIYADIKDILHLDEDVYCSKHTDNQEIFFTALYKEFKKNIAEKASQGLERLPKFSFRADDDGAFVFNAFEKNYRLFIDIEKNIDNSFYGYVFEQNGGVASKRGLLTKQNYSEVVDGIIQMMAWEHG